MPREPRPDVIAIDGPAASGKSTLGFHLAQLLGYLYLDTGCMYRALTLAAIRQGVALDDGAALTALADRVDLDVLPLGDESDGRQYTVLLDGQDITWELRLPEVDAAVSQVSAVAGVRARMVERQRAVGRRGRVVMVGRDIGTVVMPDAPLKLYVIATAEERARRRLRDRLARGHDDNDYAAILADVIRRDHIDSTREHSPLRPAADSIIIDTTDRRVDELLDEVLSLLNEVAA
ncbi:MAG: (d)CMP kinase [Candidatus Promineofilum sp.]|nr:(d)CMP kinase [Promineifilum sp.]